MKITAEEAERVATAVFDDAAFRANVFHMVEAKFSQQRTTHRRAAIARAAEIIREELSR